jgi:hypothetical protein
LLGTRSRDSISKNIARMGQVGKPWRKVGCITIFFWWIYIWVWVKIRYPNNWMVNG